MRKTSWEIVLTGLVFIGLSIYLINTPKPSPAASFSSSDSLRIITDQGVHVMELEKLERLKELENLKSLEKLKGLANFMPAEVKREFIEEIEQAIKEVDEERVRVRVNADKGIVAIDKLGNIDQGEWSVISPGVYAYICELDAKELENASLRIPFGSIVVKGTDSDKAKLTIKASGKISSLDDLKTKIKTTSEISERIAEFDIISKGSDNVHLEATLLVPSHTGVEAFTNGGHVKSSNISGRQHYHTKGGHVTLNKLEGDIQAESFGGHITINQSKGSLELKSMGGHIRAQNTEGDLEMKTAGGNLNAIHNGEIEASTNGGNIDLTIDGPLKDIEASTGAGTLTLQLPAATAANINLSGSSLEISPAFNFSGEKSSGSAQGTLNNGGAEIKAKTGYGKVILKTLD